jgi:PadR family transcriptional regulator, regulatory protein PadR
MDLNLLKGNLEVILLSILEDGERYGLEITKEANTRTDGYFKLNAGSLYPTLHRLEKLEWVRAETRQPPRGGPSVRYYRLTESGLQALRDKQKAYSTFDSALKSLWGGKS